MLLKYFNIQLFLLTFCDRVLPGAIYMHYVHSDAHWGESIISSPETGVKGNCLPPNLKTNAGLLARPQSTLNH